MVHLRRTDGQTATREILDQDLAADIAAAEGDFERSVLAIRSFHRSESLRTTDGELLQHQRFDTIAQQNSNLAAAVLEATILAARSIQEPRLGTPPASSRFVVIGFGALGASELDYSGNIELAFLYDFGDASRTGNMYTDGPKKIAAADYYQRLTQTILALLRDAKDLDIGYQVTLRNATSDASVAMRFDDAWKYYDTHGDAWDRLAFIKASPVAGDMELGYEFLQRLETWVYRRYLSQSQIASIKSLKRKLERNQIDYLSGTIDVRSGVGGIRDIEFVTQFMQLLNGSELPELRVANTLQALQCLQQQGCLTDGEMHQLSENYIFLRTVEHRIQTMATSPTDTVPINARNVSTLPSTRAALLAIARTRSFGLPTGSDEQLLSRFHQCLTSATEQNHTILKRLMYEAFGDEASPGPVVDLVLDPDPRESLIATVLMPHGFQDCGAAYHNLMSLASENVAFLSNQRCRHFLAAISLKLLPLIAATPDPDGTLADLRRVSDSLGGKGALWELFSSNPPLMELYVRLCAACPYLSGILVRNPGMLDDLMDSLVLDQLPTHNQLAQQAFDLCRGAEDIEPILHGFKNATHLSVGVRDILGKDGIRETTATLSNIAEVCLHQVVLREYERLVPRFGIPSLPQHGDLSPTESFGDSTRFGLPQDDGDCDLVILGLGKLGGREPNYHSDLDVLFVYETDGYTRRPARSRNQESTSNQHFFAELAQRVTRWINRLGPWGRLFDIDTQFASSGSKTLSISHAALCDFIANKSAVSHCQLFCKARPVFGSSSLQQRVLRDVHHCIRKATHPISGHSSHDIMSDMRSRRDAMEQTASPQNLKRGFGGTVDIEFIAQMLQLRHAADHPTVLVPGTLEAIEAINAAELLNHDDAAFLAESYRFLRSVEARLRLMDTSARHDLPSQSAELAKLAFLLNLDSSEDVERRCEHYRSENRVRFDRLFATVNR